MGVSFAAFQKWSLAASSGITVGTILYTCNILESNVTKIRAVIYIYTVHVLVHNLLANMTYCSIFGIFGSHVE